MNEARERGDVRSRRPADVASRDAGARAARRTGAIGRHDAPIHVITTSRRLAHRIVREPKKVFRGRASAARARGGTPLATPERERQETDPGRARA
jgi:hypothetical protein